LPPSSFLHGKVYLIRRGRHLGRGKSPLGVYLKCKLLKLITHGCPDLTPELRLQVKRKSAVESDSGVGI
jgi:hypothetical protein